MLDWSNFFKELLFSSFWTHQHERTLAEQNIKNKIWKYIDDDRIILLNGARQTGKTTLIKMIKEKLLQEKGVSENQILWFDLEQIDDLDIWETQRNALNSLPLKNISKKYYLFVDEFQKSSEIGSTLKVIHDHYPHIKPIITGSASWYLNIDESMAGRKIVIPIWPLNFEEFIDWQDAQKTKQYLSVFKETEQLPSGSVENINKKLLSFLSFGGYPGVNLSNDDDTKISILQDLINSYLTRDIKLWNYKANSLQVKKLLLLLSAQIGELLNKQYLTSNSELNRVALENRLELLQNTFILHLLSPYFINKKKEIVRNPKAYLIDIGLRNSLLNNFSIIPEIPEFGHIMENFAVIELLKNKNSTDKIHFWQNRQNQEVDIIIKRENKLIPIEVKGGNYASVPSGLKSFIRTYQPKKAFVLNWSIIKDEQYKNCLVKFRPIWFVNNI